MRRRLLQRKLCRPKSGRVDGAAYRNSYLGFNYFFPENWVARGTPGKLAGTANGHLLLTLKRSSGEQLSSVILSAAELNAYGGDLQRYLDARYRLHEDAGEARDMTINGISVSRGKRSDQEPALMMLGDRAFYRVDTVWGGITRVAVATEQRGYALVFELIVPTKSAAVTTQEFVDSLHGLNFIAPAKADLNAEDATGAK